MKSILLCLLFIQKLLPGLPIEQQALITSIAWTESRCDVKAVSPKGAVGLLQIMPSIAKSVIKKYGISHKIDLNNPYHNISIGMILLDEMLQDNKGSLVCTLAQFNGGLRAARGCRDGVSFNYESANFVVKVLGSYNVLVKEIESEVGLK